MVTIKIKGIEKRDDTKRNFEIATLKACVTLTENGQIYVTITDQQLSKELKVFFEERKKGENN